MSRSARHRPLLTPLAAFAAVITLKLFITRAIVVGDANPLRALVFETGFVVLALCVAALLAPRYRLWVWFGVDLVASVLCVAVLVYAHQYDDIPTLAALGVARELPAVHTAVGALLSPAYLLYFVDLAVIVVLAVRNRPAARIETDRLDRRLAAALAVSIVWVALVMGGIAAAGPIDDGLAGARAKGMFAYALYPAGLLGSREPGEIHGSLVGLAAASSRTDSRPHSSNGATSSSAATKLVLTTARLGKVNLANPASVQKRFDILQGAVPSPRLIGAPKPGVAKGKNVIIVQCEALATWPLGARVNGRDLMPNLTKLIRTSWYAPRTVSEIGRGTTSDAEFIANTSLLPDRGSPSSYLWGHKKVPSLPRLLRAKGYEAVTLHTNVITYWRRDLLYPTLGFDHWYSTPDFPFRDIIDDIGPSDAVLYEKAAEVMEAKKQAKKPFLAEMVTLTAHQPFYGAAARSKLEVPAAIEGTELGRYLKAMNLTDRQLGNLIARLRRDGLWDQSVVVIYGDHFGVRPAKLSKRSRRTLAKLLGRPVSVGDSFEVPLIVHLPGQTRAGRIDRIRTQADILPTIADVMGVDLARTPHVGASIFDTRPRIGVMSYYMPAATFVTDEYIFRPGIGFNDGKATRLDNSKPYPRSMVPRQLYNQVRALAAFNQAYLKSLPSLSERQ